MNWLAVMAGGALGSLLRYVVSGSVSAQLNGTFPFGTWTVNIAGCLLIGLLSAAWPANEGEVAPLRLALIVGGLGGFTTFSTFSAETLTLLQGGRAELALIYVASSTAFGVIAAWFGYKLGLGLAA